MIAATGVSGERRRVLVVANDHVGSKMAGPGIRSFWFAQELARDHDVTLAAPNTSDLEGPGFRIIDADPWDAGAMTGLSRDFDVVVAQRLPVPTMLRLARSETIAVYDLYAPWPIEALAHATREGADARAAFALNVFSHEVALACGDAFVCATEKQRDLWLGSLLAAGRVDETTYARDPSLRQLIDVVPFGLDPEPPVPAPALRGVVDGIREGDKVLLWPGGIWNWLDPLTVIRAVDELARRRDDIRLYFLGLRHPNPAVPPMRMAADAVALADELGLRDRVVFFNDGWVPYDERGAYLLDADVGVSAHFDDLETRFAFRTRLIDCIWAGLPVVTSAGDALSELVAERGLGRVTPVGDVAAWVAALEEVLGEPDLRGTFEHRLAAARADLEWPVVVEPLRRLVDAVPVRRVRPAAGHYGRYVRHRLAHARNQHGVGGAVRRLASVVVARAARTARRSPRMPSDPPAST